MLARVLEQEVMDSVEEARDYDSMDHSEVNRIFVADFLAVWDGENPILDVGTGTAQIPIQLCRQASAASVIGIDLAEHMLHVGRNNVERAGLHKSVRLERVDAKQLPYPAGHFAAVISNSIVHHIPEPGAVVAEILRVLRPGGTLFIRDLVRPESDAQLEQLVALYAGEANPHQRQMFADSLRAALTLGEIRQLASALGSNAGSVQQTSDRHWTWSAKRHGL